MASDEGFDDEIDINLRPREEIAARLIILAAVVRRASLELPLDRADFTGDSPEGERFDLAIALAESPYATYITPDETHFLTAPLGSFASERALAAAWRLEALAALAALVFPTLHLEQPWRQTNPGPLLALIPEPTIDLLEFSSALDMPSDESAARAREAAELWFWRAAIDNDLRTLRGHHLADLRETLAATVAEAVSAGLLNHGTHDFLVNGRPFAEADQETKALIEEIAAQRLFAFNWACGFGRTWDDVPLDI